MSEKNKTERKYCNTEHIQNTSAYCNVCMSYVCEECQIESHFNHDMINLESESLKKLSDYKKIAYSIKMTLKQYQKVVENQSIDESLSSITGKIEQSFNLLIEQIMSFKEKLLKEILESKEINEAINEVKIRTVENMESLKELDTDAQNLLAKIQEEFNNHRYILIYEREHTNEAKPLQERLEEWKLKSATNPMKLQDFENDIYIDTEKITEELNSFVKLRHRSKPSPQA